MRDIIIIFFYIYWVFFFNKIKLKLHNISQYHLNIIKNRKTLDTIKETERMRSFALHRLQNVP